MVRIGSFLLVFSMVGAASAQSTQTQPVVQVTASRIAETVDATLADVSVITREDIDASGSADVIDVLRMQAGLDIYRTGGPGSQTSVLLRGTNANQVLVLIDGVRVASTNTGAYAFDQLSLDTVERIEIVRGPRASYWGSDAIGGVIQIFTRKLDGPRVALGYGSWRDATVAAGIGHWNGEDGFSLQVGARNMRGFSATNPGICNGPDDPYCSYNPDDDGVRNHSVTLRAARRLGSQKLSASALRSERHTQFDQGESLATELAANVALEGDITSAWSHRLSVGHAREDLDTPVYFSQYQSRSSNLSWVNQLRLDDRQRLILGADFVRDSGGTRDTSDGHALYDDDRHNSGLFAGWQAAFGVLDSEVSLRHDDNSEFGGENTGSVALGWRFTPNLRAYASYGQGFRAPNLNEQFSPGYFGYFAGNPDLQPERSRSSELGLEFVPVDGQRLTASLYSTHIRNLISFTGPDNQAENINRSRIDGFELAYNLTTGPWQFGSAWTWQDPRNEDTDTVLLRRAKQKLTGSLDREFGTGLRAGFEVVASGARQDVGNVDLPGYALVNLRGSIQLAPAWSLIARLENLTDRDYELVHGYNTPGRSGYLQLVWKPGI